MNEMLEKNEIKIDDFNETLLKIQEENNKSIKEVKETIETNENEMDLTTFVAKNKWQVYKEIANIYTERSKHDNNLKEKYSRLLIRILVLQLLIMNVIFVCRGLNLLEFNDTTFNIFITATIAEVFSLVTIIVKYLFTDNLTKLLSNILTETKEENKNEQEN